MQNFSLNASKKLDWFNHGELAFISAAWLNRFDEKDPADSFMSYGSRLVKSEG